MEHPESPQAPHFTRILVVLATYNEKENLPKLLELIQAETEAIRKRYACVFDILIVDDNSPDGTGTWCEENRVRFSNMTCIHRNGKKGLGSAIIAAMRHAVTHDYHRMVNLDADLSHSPRHLPALLGIHEILSTTEISLDFQKKPLPATADVVIGSRYIPGGGISGWKITRHIMSRGINFVARTLLGLSVRDISGSYRNYAVDKLQMLDFSKMESAGYSFFEEILWRLKRVGADMQEIPIHFVDRQAGSSKLNWRESLRALMLLGKLGIKNRMERIDN